MTAAIGFALLSWVIRLKGGHHATIKVLRNGLFKGQDKIWVGI